LTIPDSDLAPVAAVIVLAAGGGTRMKSRRSKLLHELCGKSMLSYAVSAASALNPQHLVVVVGHQRVEVLEHLESLSQNVTTAVQEQQLGTGHAVTCGLGQLPDLEGEVVVTYGDVPLLTGKTLRRLVSIHRAESNAVTVLTAEVEDPTGYGRIVRTGGKVTGIVEHRDASDEQLLIREINSGIYVFDAAILRDGLTHLSTDNAQGEQYLTDILRYAHDLDRPVGALITEDVWQTEGVNDRVQLARMSQELNRRILERWMREGVTVIDPRNTWVDVDVDLSRIRLRSPYPTDTVTASGTVGWKQVIALAARDHPRMQGMTLQAKRTGTSAQEPGAIQASASLLGMSGEAEIVPSVGDDGSLVLTITSTRMGGDPVGGDVSTGESSLLSYVGLDSPEIRIPADSLPQGLRPTSAIVTNDGLRLSLAGNQVNLGQL